MKRAKKINKIDVVGGIIIENSNSEILLFKSKEWKYKWALPGGYIRLGEKIVDGLIRSGHNSTGLNLKPIGIITFGEIICSDDFHRPAHFIFFDLYCKFAKSSNFRPDKRLGEYVWLKPKDALKLNLAVGNREEIKEFLKHKRNKQYKKAMSFS
jgi:ADP-ribose pyrophosphatase YjhB (NUDIX family)